jgi:hypothetical protein
MISFQPFSDAEYLKLSHLFDGGDISQCSKQQLERFAVMLSRSNAFTHFGASGFPQVCETIRTLLIVRMSEEQNKQASRESRIALMISLVALLAGLVQAVVAVVQWVSSKPIQADEASTPLPTRSPFPSVVTLDSQKASIVSASGQSDVTTAPSTRTPAQSMLPIYAASKSASK